VEPFDWAHFLHERLDAVDRPAPLDGVTRGGYRLVYTDTPSDYQKAHEEQGKLVDLLYSVGVELDDKDGTVLEVMWDSPAFKAKLTEGTQIVAIDGTAYCAYCGVGLKDAIKAAAQASAPMELIVRNGDVYRVVTIEYHGGLRYPHLVRNESAAAPLDAILAPRP
jgi:predicted metalloprotease with PDZ domain